jgi:hypothetical protein
MQIARPRSKKIWKSEFEVRVSWKCKGRVPGGELFLGTVNSKKEGKKKQLQIIFNRVHLILQIDV